MFRWLFKARDKEKEQHDRFAQSYEMIVERGRELSARLDKILDDPMEARRLTECLADYKQLPFLMGLRQAITQDAEFRKFNPALPTIAQVFMVTVTESGSFNLPPSPDSTFSGWLKTIPDGAKHKLALFAYLATSWEQEQSGAQNPVAYGLRVILWAVIAAANDDEASKRVSRDLAQFIDHPIAAG